MPSIARCQCDHGTTHEWRVLLPNLILPSYSDTKSVPRHFLDHNASSDLFIIILSLVVNDIEKFQRVDTFTRSDHSQPISQLLLFQVLLRSMDTLVSVILIPQGYTHRYFRYLPENGMCATTSILSPPA